MSLLVEPKSYCGAGKQRAENRVGIHADAVCSFPGCNPKGDDTFSGLRLHSAELGHSSEEIDNSCTSTP